MSKVKKQEEWQDISNEEYRKYITVTGRGVAEVVIKEPKGLKIEEVTVGSNENIRTEIEHLIIDTNGEQHRIPYGWMKISFKLK